MRKIWFVGFLTESVLPTRWRDQTGWLSHTACVRTTGAAVVMEQLGEAKLWYRAKVYAWTVVDV